MGLRNSVRMSSCCKAGGFVFYGFLYFLCSPSLWAVAIMPLLCCVVAVLLVTLVFITLTLAPQIVLLSAIATPFFAPIVGLILVFAECAVIIQLLVSCCLSKAQDDIFDAVFRQNSGTDPELGCFYRSSTTLFKFTCLRLFVMVCCLPLNLIPVVGTVMWAVCSGYFLAWDAHSGFLDSKGMDFTAQSEYIKARRWEYVMFGFLAQCFELVPGLNVIGFFSNFAAAALWAAQIDNEAALEDFEQAPAATSLSQTSDAPLLESE